MGKTKKRKVELDGKKWLRYSVSVWNDINKSKEEIRLKHPAMFPSELAKRLILAYTNTDDWVLDPFLGIGSTLVAAQTTNRNGIGIEISKDYCEGASSRLKFKQKKITEDVNTKLFSADDSNKQEISTKQEIYEDDANNLLEYVKPNTIDLCVTSPPYWDILTQKRTADMKKIKNYNSGSEKDISNIHDYNSFLNALQNIFKKVYKVLKPDKRCCVVVMDIRKKDKFYPYHSDLTNKMEEIGFVLDDIIIWDRRKEYSNLRPLGYPYVFRVNKIHEFIMIYQK